MMDGEWPIALRETEQRQMAERAASTGIRQDEGGPYDLPGGKKQHDRRTKRIFKALCERFGVRHD